MERRFKFTRARLDKLPRPVPGEPWYPVYDTIIPSLCLMVGPTFSTFYLLKKIAGRTERVKIERDGVVSIDEARTAARTLLTTLAGGVNPATARRASRHGVTLQTVFADFQEHRRSRRGGFLSPTTLRGYVFDFKNHLDKLATRPMGSISHEQIVTLHARIGREHPTTANRVVSLISGLYSHAEGRKLYGGPNPARGINKFPEQARERFLREDEFPRFMLALAGTPEPWRWLFALSLFTGARRDNVLTAKWGHFDLDARLWRIPHTKRGTSVTLPLSAEVMQILEQVPRIAGTEFLFPSHGKSGHLTEPKGAWADLLARAELSDLKIHDLRRTFGSWQAMSGSSLPIIGKSLGHTTAASTQIYSRLTTQPVVDSVDKATAAMLAAAGKGNRGAAIRKVLGQTRGRK